MFNKILKKNIPITFFAIGACLLWVGLTPIKQEVLDNQYSLKPKRIYGAKYPLVGIVDASISDGKTFVLTTSFPAIHKFNGNKYEEWGGNGNGPSELNSPTSIEVKGNKVFVLDFRTGLCKIVTYDLKGNYISSYPIRGYLCKNFYLAGNSIFVEAGTFGNRKREILLLENNENLKTVAKFIEPKQVKLNRTNRPDISFPNPFIAHPVWNVDENGNVILWDGKQKKNLKKLILLISLLNL